MKKLTVLLLFVSSLSYGQLFDRATGIEYKVNENVLKRSEIPNSSKCNYKRSLAAYSVAFVGGVANGYNETISHHYSQFKKVHPGANDQFWNPEQSWLNKYEDFNGGNKNANYFGSKTFLSWTTDAYHLTSVASNVSLIGATCIITIGEKRKWWEYGIDILGMSLARSAGFHLIYSGIYK